MAGKSLNDLNLSDEPIVHSKAVDPRSTDWYRFCRDIDDLLATGKVTFAEDFLRSVQVTVEKTQRVTEGQRTAVDRIEEGSNRPRRGNSRRYEGFRN